MGGEMNLDPMILSNNIVMTYSQKKLTGFEVKLYEQAQHTIYYYLIVAETAYKEHLRLQGEEL